MINWTKLIEALEQRGIDGAERFEAFAAEHLSRWVPGFCAEVEDASVEPYYRGLAVLTGAFVRALS